ncbi:glycosyltransferase family 4 protein [Janibacter sp. GXQ6167]|uniref:glycosyltransferase family 4 protein n=1 Tax=Janibacter sp. GXQ6167 TaxID=3240791 RepID=UPI003524EE43
MVLAEGGHATPFALWVVPVSNLGGVARHVLDVASAGIPGYRLVVLCPPGPLAERLRAVGCPVLTDDFGHDAGVRASIATVRHHLRTLRPAVVHSHLSWADVVVAAAVPLRDRPLVVTTEHGIAADDLVYHGTRARSRAKAAMHHLRLRRADAAIAVSESTARVMRAKWHPSTPITVIRNGIDRPLEPARRESGLHIVSIARLAPEKRIDALLDAFAVIAAQRPEARLTIAGEGPLRSEIEARVDDLGLGDLVSLPGHVDAPELMRTAHVLAQLSVWENASYSLLDALVAGLGVVATPVGGNPEIVPASCLVDADDSSAVASALIEQGLEPAARPMLDPTWPSVAEMSASIAALYDEGRRSRGA